MTISQIEIGYRESRLSRTAGTANEHAPRAGDRFPWRTLNFESGGPAEDLFQRLEDTRFNLLVIGQPAP